MQNVKNAPSAARRHHDHGALQNKKQTRDYAATNARLRATVSRTRDTTTTTKKRATSSRARTLQLTRNSDNATTTTTMTKHN
jgi:hypothetical protein